MAAFDHHFMPLSPALEGEDYLGLTSEGCIDFVTADGHTLVVRFLCLDEQVRVIAVAIPEAARGHVSQSKWMKQIMETTLSALRLSVDREASPIFAGEGFINLMYQSDDPEPVYEVAIGYPRNPDYRLRIENVVGVFSMIAKREVAPIAALLAEAQVSNIPPHYRVLSLIRAIELLYPNERGRALALDRFESHFAALEVSPHPFRSALPQLRTRCAHGVSRGRTNPEPFVGIGYNEPHLSAVLRLLLSVVAHGLQELHGLTLGGMQYDAAAAAQNTEDER